MNNMVIEIGDKYYFISEVEQSICDIGIEDDSEISYKGNDGCYKRINLGAWGFKASNFISKLSDIEESWCKKYMFTLKSNFNGVPDVYYDYVYAGFDFETRKIKDGDVSISTVFPFKSARDSFISLLESKGFDTSKQHLIIEVKLTIL